MEDRVEVALRDSFVRSLCHFNGSRSQKGDSRKGILRGRKFDANSRAAVPGGRERLQRAAVWTDLKPNEIVADSMYRLSGFVEVQRDALVQESRQVTL